MFTSSSHSSPQVQKIIIDPEYAGQRLDNFLFNKLKGVPKTRIYRIIRKGEVRINQGRVKPDYRLVSGDLLRIPPVRKSDNEAMSPVTTHPALSQKILNDILFEDDNILVLNKPSGVAVHGGSGVSLGVIEAVRQLRGPKGVYELVHRLDRETSGCLMIAKNRATLKVLHEQLRLQQIEKIYWTLVKGKWRSAGVVTAPLIKNQLSSGERIVKVSPDGQPARTEFRVLKMFSEASLMEAKPRTGRTHQIRVHAASVNHPIAGDDKYGDSLFNQSMRKKGLKRLFLHARQITLLLPDYKEPLVIIAPLEQSLEEGLAELSGG